MKMGSLMTAAAMSVALSAGAFGAETPESLKSLDSIALAASAPLSLNSVAALPDFSQVSPGVYRSGQPTQQGVAQLAAKGIKTILKLNDNNPAACSQISLFLFHFLKEFCFNICPHQPPNIFPTSSIFTENSMYFL